VARRLSNQLGRSAEYGVEAPSAWTSKRQVQEDEAEQDRGVALIEPGQKLFDE
jgi:hypothetical protein